jgi:hypothetical protein
MSNVVTNRGKARIAAGAWTSATMKVLILEGATLSSSLPGGALDPDLDTVADLLAVSTVAEMSGTNYSRQTIGSCTITQDDTNNRAGLDGDDVLWAELDAGIVLAFAIYEDGANDAARNLIAVIDTATPTLPRASNGGDFTLQIDDLIRLT